MELEDRKFKGIGREGRGIQGQLIPTGLLPLGENGAEIMAQMVNPLIRREKERETTYRLKKYKNNFVFFKKKHKKALLLQ